MIYLIAAVGKNNELGYKNDLVWRYKNDLLHFKSTTINKKIIMGHNTYLSLGKPLPKRDNLVISRDIVSGGFSNITKEEVINKYLNSEEEVFIIGGAKTYNYFLPYSEKIYLTEINDSKKEVDCFFPIFEKDKFNKTILDNTNEEFTIVLYERKK